MRSPARSGTTLLLRGVGLLVLIGLAKSVLRYRRQPTHGPSQAEPMPRRNHGATRRGETALYLYGYGLALALTCAAFALVHWQWASGSLALGIVFGLALVQAVVHFRCFLHIDLKRNARDDLQLLLFSTLIVLLMVGGTLVVLFNLRERMM